MIKDISTKSLTKYFIIILFAALIIGCISLLHPFGRDQGTFAYCGKLILEGKIQYRYFYDIKPPLVHFVYAFAELLTGGSMIGMRIFDLLWQALTAFIIFLISLRFTKKRYYSLLPAFLYLLFYFRFDYWNTLQADGFLNLPFSVSILFLIDALENNDRTKYFISGIFISLAILFKYTIASLLPLLFIIIVFSKRDQLKILLKNYLLYLTGLLLIIGMIFLIFLITGAFSQFWHINFIDTPGYSRIGYGITPSFSYEFIAYIFSNLYDSLLFCSPLILFSLAYFIIKLVKKEFYLKEGMLFIWQIAVLINLIIQWRFFPYHFLVIFPPLAIGFAAGFQESYNLLNKKFKKIVFTSFALILIIFCIKTFMPYLNGYKDLFSVLKKEHTLKEMYIKNGVSRYYNIENTFNAVDTIKMLTKPEDKIFLWGFDCSIYYLSGRECATRFIYNLPLYWQVKNDALKKEFLDGLKTDLPKLILVSEGDDMAVVSGYPLDSKHLLEQFTEFNSLLKEKYRFKLKVGTFYFYELIPEMQNKIE